jgi:hypothetical protein
MLVSVKAFVWFELVWFDLAGTHTLSAIKYIIMINTFNLFFFHHGRDTITELLRVSNHDDRALATDFFG